MVTTKSGSGLEIGHWLKRVIIIREKRGVARGCFFTDGKRGIMRAKDLEVDILDRIVRVQQLYLDLIRPELKVHEEFKLSRSFRRGSNSEAQNRGVKDGKKRWREKGSGKQS